MQLIEPEWPAPASVRAITTTRIWADTTGLESALFPNSHWPCIQQVHGTRAINCAGSDADLQKDNLQADACYSRRALTACRVVTADCLPVLICNRQGTEVAAVHAGWRGLVAGVIENCLANLHSAPEDLLVWLGPAISQAAFEVGDEVMEAFLAAAPAPLIAPTRACFRAGTTGKHFADLYGLARLRLQQMGVIHIFGGDYCTYSQPDLFYSYRRDGTTGRMISIIVFR